MLWCWCHLPQCNLHPLILSTCDGQTRGLAALFVSHLIVNYDATNSLKDDPTAFKIMTSLINIPTVFERNRDDTAEDLLVAQAVRQNVKATMALPMNAVEWAGLILRSSGVSLGSSSKNIVACMQRFTTKYDSNLEVEAYDNVSQVPKRQRRGRSKGAVASQAAASGAPAQDAPNLDRIKIGNRRLLAIKNLLNHCTKRSFEQIENHLVWVGDYATSAITDVALGLLWIWPKSLNPPSEEDSFLLDVAAHAQLPDLIPTGLTVKPMCYDSALSQEEHNLLIAKAIAVFEDAVLHQSDRNEWKKVVPSANDMKNYRNIVQHWCHTIRPCCMVDLPKQDFEEIAQAVLFGDAIDTQILSIAKRFPQSFHVGMIPDLRVSGAMAVEQDQMVEEAIEAENAKWAAEIRIFKNNLHSDWKLIKTVEGGAQVFLISKTLQ